MKCAYTKCNENFIPASSHQKFCCNRHKIAHNNYLNRQKIRDANRTQTSNAWPLIDNLLRSKWSGV